MLPIKIKELNIAKVYKLNYKGSDLLEIVKNNLDFINKRLKEITNEELGNDFMIKFYEMYLFLFN